MSHNPYQPPVIEGEAVGVRTGSRQDLRNVATYQKGILICILIYILAVVTQFFIPPEMRWMLGVGIMVLGVISTVCVFLLAMKVYSTGVGVLLGILTLVPCLGLIVLLLVNGRATSILKQNGIKVGLLGANISDI